MNVGKVAIALTVVACCLAEPIRASPLQWKSTQGGNDHYYEFILAPNIFWTDAKSAAQALTFAGVHGYLATVTSAPESAFMAANFPEEAGPFQNGWLGGYQDMGAPDYVEPAGGWRWVSGEAWAYTNWFTSGPVEPDNLNGNQHFMRSNVGFQWDDFQNDPSNPSIQFVSGYFVEYPTPEPGSLFLVVTAGVAFRRRGAVRWAQSARESRA
jgi:hypothetical protein